jgi:putative transcriptional regulator
MRGKYWRLMSFAAAAVCGAAVVSAQSTRIEDLGGGKILVAPRNCPDPRFAETVILLVDYNEDGAAGLIINGRTKVPVSIALEEIKAAKGRQDPIYVGGPVEIAGVLGLLRSRAKPAAEATHVFGDVYLVSSKPLLEQKLGASAGPGEFRVYLGYSGWGPGQLENEVKLGGWYIFDGNAEVVFDSDPGSVWTRLIARVERQVAEVRGTPRAALR